MKYEEIIKNKRLIHFADTKDAVIQNTLKSLPENRKITGEDSSLLLFI